MPNYIRLPNGAYYEAPEGLSPAQAFEKAARDYPEAFGIEAKKEESKKSGILGALAKGAESTLAQTVAGAKTLFGDERAAAEEARRKQQDISSRYAEEVSFDKVREAYDKSGVLAAGAELASQVPKAIAEQAANIGTTMGGAFTGARLGAMAGTPFGPAGAGIGALIGGGLGAFVPSYLPQVGGNIQRQLEEGEPLSASKAAVAGVPQAALDVAANFIPFGRQIAGKVFGKEVAALLEKGQVQAAEALAKEGTAKALAKGTAVGALAEIPTEVAQQMIERAQAGLSLTTPDALAEYGQTAYQVGLLAPLGAVGRISDRGAAREKVAAEEKKKLATERKAAADAEQARLNSDDYVREVVADYAAAEQEKAALKAQIRKVEEDSPTATEDREHNKQINAQIRQLHQTRLDDLAAEKVRLAPRIKQVEEQDRLAKLTPEEFMIESLGLTEGRRGFTPATGGRRKGALGVVEPLPVEPSERDILRSYANDRVGTAKENLGVAVDLNDMADYLLSDFGKAQALVTAKPNIEGLTPKQNTDLYKALAAKVKPLQQQQQQAAASATAAAQQRVAGLESEEQAALDAQRAEQERARLQSETDLADVQREQRIAPEVEGIRRLGTVPKDSFAAANAEAARERMAARQRDEELASQLVETLPISGRQQPPGRVVSGRAGPKPGRSELQTKLQIARLTDNRIAAEEALAGLRDLEADESVGGQGQIDDETIQALGGIRRPLTAEKQQEIGAAVDEQNKSLVGIVRTLEDARRVGENILPPAFYKRLRDAQNVLEERKSDPKATGDSIAAAQANYDNLVKAFKLQRRGNVQLSLPETYKKRIQEAKETYVKAHLDELAAHHESFGLRPPADWEKAEARARVLEALNELESRWDVFSAPMAAVEVLQDQIRGSLRTNLTNALKRQTQEYREKVGTPTDKYYFEDQEGKPIEGKTLEVERERKPQIVAKELTLKEAPRRAEDPKQDALDLIKRALETLATRTRAVPTAVKPPEKVGSLADMAKLFNDEKGNAVSDKTAPEVVAFLERARDALEVTSDKDFAEMVREQAQRVFEGNLPDPFTVREIDDAIKAQKAAGVSEARPGATPEELQRTSAQAQQVLFPEAEVATTRATPKNFQRLLDSKNVQELRAAIAQQKQENQDILEQLKKYIPSLQKKMQTAIASLNKARAKAAEKAEIVAKEKGEPEWYAPAVREIVEYESALQSVPPRLKLLKDIRKQLKGLSKEDKNTLLDLIQQAKQGVGDQAVLKEYVETERAIRDPNSFKAEISKLEKVVKTASNQIDQARARLDKLLTQYQNDVVLRGALASEAEKARREVASKAAKVRELQKELAAERAKDAAEEASAATAEREFRAAQQAGREGLGLPGVRRVRDTTQLKQRTAQIRSEIGSYRDSLEKAQRKGDEAKTTEFQAKLDKAEEQLASVFETSPFTVEQLREQGEKELADAFEAAQIQMAEKAAILQRQAAGLPAPRLAGRVVGPTVKDIRTGKKTQAGTRQTVSTAADDVTDRLVKQRAELAEFDRRIAFLRGQGKPVPRTLLSDRAAKNKEVIATTAEQTAIAAEERASRSLVKTQTQKEVSAELRRAEQTGDEFRPENISRSVMRTATKAGPSLKEQTVKNIADKVMADWSVTPQVEVVASENELPAQIRDQLKAEKMEGKVPGLYYPDTKTVYLIASGLKDANDVVLTIAHEVAGHFGLREMLGNGYAPTMNRLYDGNKLVRERADAKMQENTKLSREIAVEEVLADMAETGATPQERNVLQRFYDYIKRWLANKFPSFKMDKVTDNEIRQIVANARRYVMEGAPAGQAPAPAAESEIPNILYRTKAPTAPGFEDALETSSKLIAEKEGLWKQVQANLGLGFRTQFLDRLAPIEKAAGMLTDSLRGSQMMYYMRMIGQTMNFVQQSVGRGVPQLTAIKRDDGRTEYVFQSQDTTSLADVVKTLKETPGMNASAANRLFTLYLAGVRGERVGFNRLNFSVPESEIKAALEQIRSNDAVKDVFERAREQYNEYNRDLIKLLESTGAIPPDEAKRLASTNDYIPFYREEKGNAVLVIGGEGTYKIGNLKEQPQLKQLLGGDQKIYDFLTSSVQNTNMIVDMALRNQAVKNAMYEMNDLGLVKFMRGKPEGPDIVRFKDKGKDVYAQVNSQNTLGIPPELLVKGLEGIPVNNSALVKAMALPATFLRRAITVSPLYAARQLFRDSVAAPLLSGADFTPVLGALKQLGAEKPRRTLESRGIVGGQVYTGTNEDLSRILGELQEGRVGIGQLIAKGEAIAMEADALTRRAQYESYINQGLSEMEATLASLESMNFNRRGLSPSVRLATQLIPFFNAQMQSLDVLYRSLTGKMPMNERLDIQGKLFRRGALMVGTAVAYAMLMQDDEAYKNANPDEKYGNFFVRIPGVDEAIRIPVPFEIGYIFKALPEAIVNSMANERGSEEAFKAFKNIAIQTIPGGTSMLLPAAVKPIVENVTNYSFFTGRGIETTAEQMREAASRYRDNTSELAKQIGAMTGTSPLKIENLIRGYTGGMGIALAQAFNLAMPDTGPEKAVRRLSDTPVVGPLFQPNDAGGIISATYDRINELKQMQNTFKDLVKDGRTAEARAYLQENAEKLAAAAVAGNVQTQLQKVTQAMNAIKASGLTPEEKREQLDKLQKLRIRIAEIGRGAIEKTIPQ